jgi:cytochrome c peroxidase
MGDYFVDRGKPVLKSDMGRFNVTGREADRHMFKVPTLRNVARTGPYFHDGSIDSLEDAVNAMARYQLGVELGVSDRVALVAFLHALNGRMPAQVQ